MSLLWVLPLVVLVLGGVAVFGLARAASSERRALMSEIARFGELHVALSRVQTELQRSSSLAGDLRQR